LKIELILVSGKILELDKRVGENINWISKQEEISSKETSDERKTVDKFLVENPKRKHQEQNDNSRTLELSQ
jgi:hypothetical protein